MSIPRLQSGKIERHKIAIQKYQEFENSLQNKAKLNDMIQGNTSKTKKPDTASTKNLGLLGTGTGMLPPIPKRMQNLTKHIRESAASLRPARPVSGMTAIKVIKLDKTDTFDVSRGQLGTSKSELKRVQSARQRNFYQPVSNEKTTVKHISGYQTINLTTKDFIAGFDQEYQREKERKMLEKHFQTSAIDPRLESPYIRTDTDASRKVQIEQEQKGELEITKKRKAMFMSDPTDGNGRFLPLDFYYLEKEYGWDLIKKYAREGYKCLAHSKWFDTKGDFTMEPCEVLSYNQEQDKYEVMWLRNGKTKLVTRINLIFDEEDKNKFESQLEIAEYYRKRSEVFIKYNYMINQMNDPTSKIDEDQLNRILMFALGCYFKCAPLRDPIEFAHLEPSFKFNFKRYLVPQLIQGKPLNELLATTKYKTVSINNIMDEVRQHFIRANHQIMFDDSLPHSEEKQKLFKGYIPDTMFIQMKERKEAQPPSRYPSYGIGPSRFMELFEQMKRQLHQAHPIKLKALIDSQETLMKFQEQTLFQLEFQQPVKFDQLDALQKYRVLDSIRDFKSRMYDIHFEIMDMVEEEVKLLKKLEEERFRLIVLEAERRALMDQDLQSETLDLLKKFQKLINSRFERAGRALWERSIYGFINLLAQVNNTYNHINNITDTEPVQIEHVYQYAWNLEFKQFDNELLLITHVQLVEKDPNSHTIQLEPSADKWQEMMGRTVSHVLKEITNINCMRTREIGAAREDMMIHFFEDMSDPIIHEPKTQFNRLVQRCLQMLIIYFNKLKEFAFLLESQQVHKDNKKQKKSNYDDFSKEIDKLNSAKEGLQKYVFNKQLRIGIFQLDCSAFLDKCKQKLDEATKALYGQLIEKIEKENHKLEEDLKITIQRLKYTPKNIEELHELRVYARDTLPEELKVITKKINKVMEKMTLTEKMHYEISYEDFSKSWSIYGMPLKLMRKQEKCLKRLQNEERGFQDDLMAQQAELGGEISAIQGEFDILSLEHKVDDFNRNATRFSELGERIDKAQMEAEIVNRRESYLKWKLTDYSEILKIRKNFAPYNRVWQLANDFQFKIQISLNTQVQGVKREEFTAEVQDSWAELYKLEKTTFKIIPHMLVVIQHFRKLYEMQKPALPVINDLLNPAFVKKEHRQRLNELINSQLPEGQEKFEDYQTQTLQKLLEYIMPIAEDIRDISEKASKEMVFEKTINKMKSEWRNIKFEMVAYRDTGTYIIKGVEPIFDKLDEDIAKTTSIASSPNIKFLEKEVRLWLANIFRVQETVEIWCKVQRSWQYLQPIFYSEDIIREMPKEGNKYQTVDKQWRAIMASTQLQPNVLETCMGKLKENLTQMYDELDKVIKGLNEFLNKKRQAFPRFYFLSNEELLQILAQAREPRAVQKHLNKCFEGIDYLTFVEGTLEITEMQSREGEVIQLVQAINPLDKDGNVRGVEEWLYELQQNMKATIKNLIPLSIQQSSTLNLKDLIKAIPAQMVISSFETIFTNTTTEAILGQKTIPGSLQKQEQAVQQLLLRTVSLLREGTLNAREAQTLGVIVVLQVKQKDVVSELLEKEVSTVDNFDWMAQMRFYWDKDLLVKILHTKRTYGYEYLGNQSRLVITPLTDRCYRTLMASLHMNLGGAPEGPAGTGKTETTKDLSKSVAKHCVVFNCSDQLDYAAMGKFFKGLVSCGSWACFDEFNRIELEVLSVIAQQILTIQTAIIRESQSKTPLKQFTFENVQLQLDATCAIFITMNPGYQGRSELPDNLKALFRSVAMMIPNYAMISEISLYSFGFEMARQLSIKITSSLKLASEQLSTQSHYDFGMRAVKSILTNAGQLKRDYPTVDEELLVLRAIEDCNLPKFTVKDVPLFEAIISDLFPTINKEARQYGLLGEAIDQIVEQQHLTMSDRFKIKIIQLHETINVRHGLMLVGGTISGKSTILKSLADSYPRQNVLKQKQEADTEQLAREKQQSEQSEEQQEAPIKQVVIERDITSFKPEPDSKVHIYPLNPKSITPRLLYGDVDEATNEWQDGIAATIFRECQEESLGMRWVVFDGPVDALWIENMNTVLDDNKKLCLSNGETIKLTNKMRIIFEVEDLMEASPATVSRCGMVYLEPQEIGWKSLFKPWQANLTQNFKTDQHTEVFNMCFFELLSRCFDQISSHYRLVYVQSQEWMAISCLRLFHAFILGKKTVKQILHEIESDQEKELARQRALEMEGKPVTVLKKPLLTDRERSELVAQFATAIIWSLGSLIEEQQRKYFSDFLISELKSLIERDKSFTKELIPPTDTTLYEVFFDMEKKNWNLWNNKPDFRIPKETAFHDIQVPTTDSQRNAGLLRALVMHDYPILFYGKTGTGKTMIVKRFLLGEVDPNLYLPTITAFSANTSCLQVLEVLEQKLEKQKRRKGVYGPLVGTTNLIFIDDLNMPAKEQFGAQPPLEMVRQWFAQGGWYDKKSLERKTIIDIVFSAAMGLGRPNISQRLIRHFNMIYIPELDQQTLHIITAKICEWGFDEYVDKVKFASKALPSICYDVYSKVGQTFLPLPKKSHYLFNLRDLMKVVQGLMRVPASKYEATGDAKKQLLRLWIHENQRVYSDRFVDDHDKSAFNEILREVLSLDQAQSLDEILTDEDSTARPKSCLYGNFLEAHSAQKLYQELSDFNKLNDIIKDYLAEYNVTFPKKAMDLVLFEDAIQFLCKVNRIISQPFGNALLVGLGGTGCRTLSRLAAFMQDYEVGEPDVQDQLEWEDFLRDLFKNVGLKNRDSIFLLTDAQISNEKFLEDLNNILNIGEIPNLYAGEDKENLLSDIKDETDKEKLSLSALQLWEYFVKRCKMNLHVIIYLSPVGDKLKQRVRNFPSLVSCTSTIWVQPWSEAALREVAIHYIGQNEAIADVCVGIHQSVQNETSIYEKETGKYYYVTPLSYMKMLSTFEKLYEEKKVLVKSQRSTYLNGVNMLDECGLAVQNMAKELESLQPILIQKTAETEEIMRNVEIETAQAEKQRIIVQSDEVTTKAKADLAAQIQNQCKERLSEAEPQLEEALNALRTLQVKDFVEMKSFQNPPKLIRLTMDAVCIMNDKKPKKTDGQDDYWEEAKKLLTDPGKFLKALDKYNRNNIPEKIIQKMTAFLAANKQFTPQTIAKASQAAEGLCKWVIAIYNYHHVYKAIQPLREDLEKANSTLKEAQDNLSKKQAQLNAVEQKCQDLRDQFEDANFQKQKLKAQITDCEIKMRRAIELTSGLSGERIRWRDSSERLQQQMNGLLGDMLLSVGYLNYMGAFTAAYRGKIRESMWIPLVKAKNVPCSAVFSLVDCLSSNLEVQEWILSGLPLDDVSTENAIIMKQAQSYPLIIDPQQQASKFIIRNEKRLAAERNDTFQQIKIDKRLPLFLETCIRMGKVLLIQGVQQSLESVLDPILMKKYQIVNGKPTIAIQGGNTVEVHQNFRLFLVTSLPNPHYTPSVLTKVTLINFTITPEALRDQMTSILVREEEPQLEEEKIRIMNENADYKVKMQLIESKILAMISSTDGAKMLEDEKLVSQLSESKATSEEISQRLKEAKVTEERIYTNRQNYDNLARFASNLYFTILSLGKLDPMYQFSLEFFVRVSRKAIRTAEKPPIKNVKQRVVNIGENLKRVIFYEVSRSIFVKDKNLFAFLLLLTYLDSNDQLDKQELNFLLNGLSVQQVKQYENPDTNFFSPTQWQTLVNLTSIGTFKNLCQDIRVNTQQWVEYLTSPNEVDIPENFSNLTGFSKLLIVRSARPEFFGICMRELIIQQLGSYFVQNLVIPLENSFNDSGMLIPLIYVLQPGDDPLEEVKRFSQLKSRILSFVSLGKGQGESAEKAILEALSVGTWVILQNCHLAVSWLPRLEALLEQISQDQLKKEKDRDYKSNGEFRLWLTTMSTDKFPQSLLMDGVKMTKDPPRGVKDNIIQVYSSQNSSKQDKAFYATCGNKSKEWKQLYLGLCFFHALVRERRRYGPVGWNIYYDFNDSDFRISMRQLKQMLSEYEDIPFKALNYLTGECYYGGKVTDDWDRRVLKEILQSFYKMEVFYENYKFSKLDSYFIPEAEKLETMDNAIEFIHSLPDTLSPEIFGLHPNSAITQAQLETSNIIQSLVFVGIVQGSSSGSGIDKNRIMLDRAQELIDILPPLFDAHQVSNNYKINYYESMNTVLIQEVLRYNNLLKMLSNSLKDLIKAAQGLIVMSPELEKIGESLINNILPQSWKNKSYPSLKPLMNYWNDLKARVQMFQSWIDQGPPTVYWVSGFYFTQSFFTGVLQNYARKQQIPIDQLQFDFQVMGHQVQSAPESGVYIKGLFLEAASWSSDNKSLDEAIPNQIYFEMPIVWFIPKKISDIVVDDNYFLCPVYKTTERKGTLSTTGHSTNFIIAIKLETKVDPSHWVKRGTALISQLNE